MHNIKQTVLLIGGMYGVGKSTLAEQVKNVWGANCYNFDFADVYHQKSGIALSQSKQGDQYRDANWADTINGRINHALQEGYELVIANSSFLIGDRRRIVLKNISQETRVLPVILTPSLLVPYHQIKSGRPEGTHIVNVGNARQSLHKLNRQFIASDNSDLLLPTDRYTLPKEYMAMLYRNEANGGILFESPKDELERAPRWVLIPQKLEISDFVRLIASEAINAFDIREIIENNVHYDIERSLQVEESFGTPLAFRK